MTAGYIALLQGRAAEAHVYLHDAWSNRDDAGPDVAALTAQRLALHGVGRLRGEEVVGWARRAVELAGPDDPVRVEAEALLGLGLGWVGRPAATHRPLTVDDHPATGAGDVLAFGPDDPAAVRVGLCGADVTAGRLGVVRGVVVRVVGAGGVCGGGVG